MSVLDLEIKATDHDLEQRMRQLLTECVRRAIKVEGGLRVVLHMEIRGMSKVPGPVPAPQSKRRARR